MFPRNSIQDAKQRHVHPTIMEQSVSTADLTLTTSYQDIQGDGPGTIVAVTVEDVGDYLVFAFVDYLGTGAGDAGQNISVQCVVGSTAQTGAAEARLYSSDSGADTASLRGMAARAWKVSVTSPNTTIKIQAKKTGGTGTSSVDGVGSDTCMIVTSAFGGAGQGGGGGQTDHGALTGLSDDDHTQYRLESVPIDLTTDVTGDLPLANLAPSTAIAKLLGRGLAAGAGDWQEIGLDNLNMVGTTLTGRGHTIQENGGDLADEQNLDFVDADAGAGLVTDDAINFVTRVHLDLYTLKAATPGGELGGTYASPTVDATHSGSAHHNAATIGADGQHSLATQVLSGVAASATQVGHVELATIAETDTGTDATRAVTPDGLAGSNYGERTVGILVSDPNGDAITTGDSKAYAVIPSTMNGWNLVEVAAQLSTVSSSGIPTVQIHRSRRASATTRTLVDMLSTKLTIDASEFESSDAAAAAVIDTANDDVNTGDQVHVDIDVAGTGAKGLFVVMTFRLP